MYGDSIPSEVTLCLSNGKKVQCVFVKRKLLLSGSDEIFRVTSLCLLDSILFTYYGDGYFEVSVFAVNCLEKRVWNDNAISGKYTFEKWILI